METEKKRFLDWIKEHKQQLILAGVSVMALIGIVIGVKNRDSLIDTWEYLKTLIDKKTDNHILESKPDVMDTDISNDEADVVSCLTYQVSSHLRNLHEGWNASATKIALAAENGYELCEGQTWVESYYKGGRVA